MQPSTSQIFFCTVPQGEQERGAKEKTAKNSVIKHLYYQSLTPFLTLVRAEQKKHGSHQLKQSLLTFKTGSWTKQLTRSRFLPTYHSRHCC